MLNKYESIKLFLAHLDQPNYRFDQIIHAVFREGIGDFNRMTALPQKLRAILTQNFGRSILTIKPILQQSSQQVNKILFQLPDANRMETVSMIYKAGWHSFCISSQCGCNLGCRFCATGAIGLQRNLTTNEITDQLLFFSLQGQSLDSVSFMGMGEPLLNKNVFAALDQLTDPAFFGLSPRRITVSTVGIVPNIRRMTRDYPQINLTFSLHSPFNEQRSLLMPVNKRYPLEEVMDALDEHIQQTSRKIYIAYVLLPGVNDSAEHAKAVIQLLKSRIKSGRLYHVNLIRHNPTVDAPVHYGKTDEQAVQTFYATLKAGGIHVTIRKQFGIVIDAACGQLYGRY